MLEVLTGTGLAASSGLNAYIPLLTIGVLSRYTDAIAVPAGWDWLSNGWVIGVLSVLLVVEVVADKVPAVDSINDALQTAIRPTSGGLVFGATSGSETTQITNPEGFFADNTWAAVLLGVTVALVVHLIKTAARPVLNMMSGGLAAPLVSTAEDGASLGMSVVAILIPLAVIAAIALLAVFGWWVITRRRNRDRISTS